MSGLKIFFMKIKEPFIHTKEAWVNLTDWLSMASSITLMMIGIAGIIFVLIFSLRILNKKNKSKTVASLVLVSCTVLSCLCMIPTIAGFNSYVTKSFKQGEIAKLTEEIENRRLKKENAEKELELMKKEKELIKKQVDIDKKSIEIEGLQDSLRLLNNTMLNVQSFREILEAALLETDFQQTKMDRERFSIEKGWGLKADYYYDEALVVQTYNFKGVFGIDLKDVKIKTSKDANNILWVSGIKQKLIGIREYEASTKVCEMRRVDVKKDGKEYRILNDSKSQDRAKEYGENCRNTYQDRLNKGLETNFLDDPIKKLAKNFITLILAPLQKEIRFKDDTEPGAVSLEEYLNNGLQEKKERIASLEQNNKDIEKQLEIDKKQFEEASKQFKESQKELEGAQKDLDELQTKPNSASLPASDRNVKTESENEAVQKPDEPVNTKPQEESHSKLDEELENSVNRE
ncbi:hypothetical protein [Treponema phagedenis]|uniref:Uncharacterized protein n=1 Tax=Treponema phagedenis TaxID=162 RepID=A0A0B7GY53_TREPH|nr:hypothetical protein [Treponema phagedenis]QEJ95052.1 hypothetical protein FUT79_07475 [Treponema phagedenis]QEK00977.1 hypothetical protein FUT84_07320 [Treponema phagedenis]QEK05986.1 hypothetical protein FUT80_04215 [Treponema phagedenis]QSH94493.1 hypothetical protein C5O78_05465 [Treponema phagedenis]CEM61551.1 conserved hypothetical protein [Treponema phagedenis]